MQKNRIPWRCHSIVFHALACVCLLCIFATFTGCASRRGVEQDILDYQRDAALNEARDTILAGAIDSAVCELIDLTERSRHVEGNIDALIELFDEYQRQVEQIIRAYREAASNVEDNDRR